MCILGRGHLQQSVLFQSRSHAPVESRLAAGHPQHHQAHLLPAAGAPGMPEGPCSSLPEADVVCDETDGKDVEGGAAADAVVGGGRGVVPYLHAGEVAAYQVVDFQAGGSIVLIRDSRCLFDLLVRTACRGCCKTESRLNMII